MNEEYKARGAQLLHPPEVRGIPYDEWIKTRVVASAAALRAWIADRNTKAEEPKKKTHSGALPKNTEWL